MRRWWQKVIEFGSFAAGGWWGGHAHTAYCLFAERSYAMSCALCLLGLRDFFRI
ncbi:conserved domain protein [Eggerthella sp. HGA1]|nr:conserved domain protein [Eggerthella sp. HGA1]